MTTKLQARLRSVGDDYDFHQNALVYEAADRLDALEAALSDTQRQLEAVTRELDERQDRNEFLEKRFRAHSQYAKRPILYTDGVNGEQCCRDDLWAVSTAELNQQAEELAVLEKAYRRAAEVCENLAVHEANTPYMQGYLWGRDAILALLKA